MSKTYRNGKLLTAKKEFQEPKTCWSLKSGETHTDSLILYEWHTHAISRCMDAEGSKWVRRRRVFHSTGGWKKGWEGDGPSPKVRSEMMPSKMPSECSEQRDWDTRQVSLVASAIDLADSNLNRTLAHTSISWVQYWLREKQVALREKQNVWLQEKRQALYT